jgi:hypothetical protein
MRRPPPDTTNYTARRAEKALDKACELSDDLRLIEQIKAEISPLLQEDLKNKDLSPEQMLEKYQKYAAARIGHIVANEPDSGKALAAAKDLLDRTLGKPKERQVVTHKYEDLTDDELDALVTSRTKK